MRHITGLLASCALLLSACGGGGGSSPAPSPTAIAGAPTPTPAPSPTCSLENRQAFARDVLNEWYLFPELLVTSANPDAAVMHVQTLLGALTSTTNDSHAAVVRQACVLLRNIPAPPP